MSNPSDFEGYFRQIASLSHYPAEQFKVFKSAFPLLQNVASRHLKKQLPDVPFWNSAIPFVCVLGRAKQENFPNPDATNLLICLNTLHVITHVLKANSHLDLDDSDRDDLVAMLNILADVIEKFKEPLSSKRAHIMHIVQGIKTIAQMVEKKSQDNNAFLPVLKKLIRNTKKCTHVIKDLFEIVFFNTDYSELVPLVMQFYLDLQTVGLFECLAERFNDWINYEPQFLEAFRLLFTGQQDDSSKIYLQQSERFMDDAHKQLNSGRMSIFCAAASKAASVSCAELAKGADAADVMRYFQSFKIPQYNAVPFDFSRSIIALINLILKKEPNHELTKQLATSLDSHTTDMQLKYLCSCAAYFPDAELGYLALMGAYLPVALNQRIAHLESLLTVVAQAYIQTDNETREFIKNSGVSLPNHVQDVFTKLPTITHLSEAEKSFAVLVSISQIINEQGKADNTFINLTTNLNHLLCSWIVSLAYALQAATITFVPNAISSIEKNTSIKQNTLNSIHQAFDIVCNITLYMATPTVINELITNVSRSMLALLPLIEGLIANPPISLIESEKEFQALLNFGQVAIRIYEELRLAMQPIEFESSIYHRHQVLSLISPVYGQMHAIPEAIKTTPEKGPPLILETKMLLTSYMNILYNVDRSVDVKVLTDEFNKLSQSNEPEMINLSIQNIDQQLSMISTQANQVEIGQDVLSRINVNSDQDLATLIQMITNPVLQQASYDLLQVLNEYDSANGGQVRTQNRDALLNLLTLRINGYQQLDLHRLLMMSDTDLRQNALLIYSSLPLYSGVYTHQIQQLGLPLLLQTDIHEMRESLEKIVNHLTITIPLQEQLRKDISIALTDRSVDISGDLEQIAQTLQLDVFLSTVDDSHIRSLCNAASLYCYSAKPVYDEQYVINTSECIYATRDVEQIRKLVNELADNLIYTAIMNGHFSERTFYRLKVLLKAMDEYSRSQSETAHRALYGAAVQLPYELEKTGQMTRTHLELAAHALHGNPNIAEQDSLNFYNAVNPSSDSLYSCLITVPDLVPIEQKHKDSVKIRPIKKPPQIVRRIIKKTHPPPPVHVRKIIKHIVKVRRHVSTEGTGNISLTASQEKAVSLPRPPSISKLVDAGPGSAMNRSSSAVFNPETGVENTSSLRIVRLVESARNCHSLTISLKNMILDESPNLDSILADFAKYATYLSTMLSDSHDSNYEQINTAINETREKVVDLVSKNNTEDAAQFDELIKVLERATHDIIFLCLQSFGVTNNAQAELFLMASKVDSLQNQLDESLTTITQDMGPLQQRVASSAKELFKHTRSLGLEARAQTEFLSRLNQSVSDEQGLIKAAMQTSDAAQMFFLLLKLFAINDPDIVYKTVAACKGMRVALTNIIVNLRAKGGSNEIARRIETISEQIFSKLQYILELAEELINQENTIVKPANQRSGLSLIVQRRNADSEVFKKRRALEEAENEIKRLNRAASRRSGT